VPNTTDNFDIPFLDGTELVRDYPQFSEDLAEAIDDGLSAAGGLVAVKHAVFTGTQTNSTASRADFAVTNLSITHQLADAANKLIISAFFGAAGTSDQRGNVGIAIMDGTTLLNIGDAAGTTTRLTAGGITVADFSDLQVTMPSIQFVYEPPDTSSRTYTVRAINAATETRTIFINRNQSDTTNPARVRAASGFVIQEVKV